MRKRVYSSETLELHERLKSELKGAEARASVSSNPSQELLDKITELRKRTDEAFKQLIREQHTSVMFNKEDEIVKQLWV
jgi:hypothetical protein